jgi:hypothetical protein
MPASESGPIIERFDYSRVGTEWAVLRLLAGLGTGLAAPSAAHLVVDPDGVDEDLVYAAACACGVERRLLTSQRGGSELLWRASFALPLDVVKAPYAVFTVKAADGVVLALPAPGMRVITPRALRLSPRRVSTRAAIGIRQRFAALATAVVVTATSTPAAAFAAVQSGSISATGAGARRPATAAVITAPATTTATSGAAAVASPSATGAAPAPSAPSTMSKRLIVVRPQTGSDRHASPAAASPIKHLFSTHSRSGHRAGARPPGGRTGCHTLRNSAAIVFAEHRRGSSQRVACRTAAAQPARRHHPAAGTLPKFSTAAGASAAPRRPSTGPPRPAHRPTAHRGHGPSPATGGAPLTHPVRRTPTRGSVPTLSSQAPGFMGPKAWTGTVMANPALTGAVTDLSGLLSDGNRPPSFLIPIYMQAGHRFGVPWEVLASINAIESDYGRDLSTSTAGALGWMQFEPSTWHQYGMAVDGHSVPNPYDPRDAIFSAARYLAAAGARDDITTAVFAYNHATWYVDEVMSRAQAIATHVQYERQTVSKRGTFSVEFATGLKRRPTVSYQGGVLPHYDRLIAAANMVSAADFPYLYGGGHEQPARFGPFDCSGSVSYVMQQAGYKVPTTVSGDIPFWKFPTGPGRVTIFYNPVHTFMRIGNRYFGTSGFARPGGGAGWFDVNQLPEGYLATFHEVHVPGLGTNSFAPGLPVLAPRRHRGHKPAGWSLKGTFPLSSWGSFPRR